MKKTTAATTIAALALALTACGSSEWSEEEKAIAWERQLCQDYSSLGTGAVAFSLNLDILHDRSMDRAERQEAADVAKRLSRSDTVGEVINPTGGWNCEGWLWERHKSEDSGPPEDFTQQLAEERGLLEDL